MADFNTYLGVKFKFDSVEARADIIKLLNDLDYFEKKLKNNFDTESIKRFTSAMDTAKQGLYEFGVQVDTVTQQSFQNFRAVGQMDRITREFASGGLTQGLNGLTMFGNSLTRLAVQEGGFKNAIQGLAGAFTGPAGIVLALSAAIGLFEAYQKNVKKSTDANDEFIKSLNEINKKVFEIAGSSQAKLSSGGVLAGIVTDPTKDIKIREAALNSLKSLYSESEELDKLDIKSKEANNKQLLMYVVNRAATQDFDISNQKNYETKLTALYARKKQLEDERDRDLAKPKKDIIGSAGVGAAPSITTIDQQNALIISKANEQIKKINDLIVPAEAANKRLLNAVTTFSTPEKQTKVKDFSLLDQISALEREIELTKKWADEEYRLYHQREEFAKKNMFISKADTGVSNFNDYLFEQKQKQEKKANTPFDDLSKAPKIPEWMNAFTESVNKNDEAIKKEYKDYKDFSNLLSKTLTKDIMGLWDAMQKGESIGDAIGQMFSKLAEQIAAAAIQAALFTTILDLVSGGTSGGAGSSFGDIFGSLLGISVPKHAEGGITTGPSIGMIGEAGPEAIMPLSKLGNVMNNSFNAGAMSGNAGGDGSGQFVLKGSDLVLALQRSNFSLNVRR